MPTEFEVDEEGLRDAVATFVEADVRRRLRGAHVSLAEVGGEMWLRSVAANPLGNPELVVQRILRAAQESSGPLAADAGRAHPAHPRRR